MKKTNKIILVAIVLTALLLGVGYAAIQNVTLNVSGTAKSDPSQSNFKVMFSGTPEVSDTTKVTAAITDDTNATINVSGLKTKGETATAIYTVQNASTDISADLSVETKNSNTEYFTLKSELGKTSLVAGEATTLTVTVELTKVPIEGTVSSTIGIQTTATPVEPGKEGTSGNTNGSSQTPIPPTLADVTNENIGDYIDIGNNIVGTESTSDDWRILYTDGNTVYAILADYLPATQVPASAGLDTDPEKYPYSVWSAIDRDTLLNGLNNKSIWNYLANGINGATATGVPTPELIINSYNIKNSTEFQLKNDGSIKLDKTTQDYDLYSPEFPKGCYKSWLNLPCSFTVGNGLKYVWNMSADSVICGCNNYAKYNDENSAIRPVVELPANTKAKLENGIWEVELPPTLAEVKNENIGDYIDLGNNVIGTENTSDDWRILYTEGDTVYAILADYLPNSTDYAVVAGLEIDGTYSVYAKSGMALLNGLEKETVWNDLANKINGATARGAATVELLMNSYNTKNKTNLDYVNYLKLDSKSEEYDLYVPHTERVDNCSMYWLASNLLENQDYFYGVTCEGIVSGNNPYNGEYTRGIRPVVALPTTTKAELVNGVWKIIK